MPAGWLGPKAPVQIFQFTITAIDSHHRFSGGRKMLPSQARWLSDNLVSGTKDWVRDNFRTALFLATLERYFYAHFVLPNSLFSHPHFSLKAGEVAGAPAGRGEVIPERVIVREQLIEDQGSINQNVLPRDPAFKLDERILSS